MVTLTRKKMTVEILMALTSRKEMTLVNILLLMTHSKMQKMAQISMMLSLYLKEKS